MGGSCRVCSSQRLRAIVARETMYRTGEHFDYLECEECGTLQIAAFPTDMSSYYPEDYYSFRDVWINASRIRTAIKRRLLPLALRFPKSRLANYFRKHAPWLLYVRNLRGNSRILDVGCGKGHLLRQLHEWGFRDLWGADPYVTEEVNEPGLRILKTNIFDLRGPFDLIMMHHSLEHVEDPLGVMADAARLLASNGSLVIRIPLKGGYLWEHYGSDWVQLDAPRHFTLFTKEAFIAAARRLQLSPQYISFDAQAFSIRGSEAIRRGRSIWDLDAFSSEENAAFELRIGELNRAGLSDQACFILIRN